MSEYRMMSWLGIGWATFCFAVIALCQADTGYFLLSGNVQIALLIRGFLVGITTILIRRLRR